MRKFHREIIVISLLAGIGVFAIAIMIGQGSWEKVSEADSPDGKFTIFQYNHFSDGDRHAPYGRYIFIKPGTSKKDPIESHIIFAGYCSNDNLYKWVSNTQIDVTCIEKEKNSVKTLSSKAYGVNISVFVESVKNS